MASTTLPPVTVPPAAESWEARLGRALFAPVDIGMLVFFRVAFGVIMLVEAWRYLSNGADSWVIRNYVDPDFHFTFYGFSWVRPWPGDGMVYAFWAMGVLAACIAAGFLYRIATVLFFLNFAHIFLCDQTYYLNHFYLLTLVSLMMCFLPAHRAWSLDVLLRPKLYSPTVPAWTLRLIQFHVAIAYFYGGVAKLNADWFLGEPMRSALAARPDFPLIGQWFGEEWMVQIFVWGGVLFDLLVVPALLWPRTRMAAFLAALGFHLTNSILFQIGIFPWFMVAGTIVFFPPEWMTVEGEKKDRGDAKRARGKRGEPSSPESLSTPAAPTSLSRGQKLIAGVLAAYVALHLVVPFRHLLYPGNVSWTEEGHLYAWHMKLRRKSGDVLFHAVTSDGRRLAESTLLEHASDEQRANVARRRQLWSRDRFHDDLHLYITPRQRGKMAGRPEMILQYAHFLADEFRRHGYGDVAIHCESAVSLNGRPHQPIVDPALNLAAVESKLGHAEWILPLEHPLPRRGTGATGDSADEVE